MVRILFSYMSMRATIRILVLRRRIQETCHVRGFVDKDAPYNLIILTDERIQLVFRLPLSPSNLGQPDHFLQ
jgi:hypothetical protein